MRTTVDLPEDMLQELKLRAAKRHSTISAVITKTLRASFARDSSAVDRTPVRLTTDPGHGGLRPGVRLDDNATLLDIMEDIG